ncbi:MAG: phosphatase PAP2 family protein [Bacteroidota bacterium]
MSDAFSFAPPTETALHEPVARIETLEDWATFHVLFPLAVIIGLIIYALVHGSTAHILPAAAYSALFTALWFLTFGLRERFPKSSNFFRYMLPLILYGVAYLPLHEMLTAARPSSMYLMDDLLHGIDVMLFGTDPIAWLGNHGSPLLTDALYLSYFSYYFGMPVLMILMFRGNRRKDFHRALAAMIIGWYGALFTYAMFPAIGPCRWMPDLLPQLHGWLPTTAWIQAFLNANLVPAVRDCVPSMHTGVTLLTLIFAYRFQRRYFWIFLLPGLGIIIATMYTQAHYAIDVILGIAAAGVIYRLSEMVYPEKSPTR